MGPAFIRRVLGGNSAGEIFEKRFQSYYPRAYAYLLSNLGNPGRARDLVTEAFAAVLAESAEMPEDQFRLELFSDARALYLRETRIVPLDFGLSEIEREALTLLFDARLTLDEAQTVCGTQKLTSDFQRALTKLRNAAVAPEVPAFYRTDRSS
jgi:DNA-directed RNA polymerase specialized sigma24 family protein